MAHSEKCPVCGGSGKYEKENCHGCNGRGWIVIGYEPVPYIPQPYYPINPQPWPRRDYWYPYSPNYPYDRWTYTITTDSVTSGTTYQMSEDAQIYYTSN